ncbi:Protein of unknown function [Cotesia congregata]|uniref:Uncharacterized protein n=1 Tax=Cotesia congregata TaxID=51543 RepID=A0A8J2MBN8_COTCN|nr:Protein of unknown function [Cotesia congregata]
MYREGKHKLCYKSDVGIYEETCSFQNENCYKCLIINDRHKNVIQFRERSLFLLLILFIISLVGVFDV